MPLPFATGYVATYDMLGCTSLDVLADAVVGAGSASAAWPSEAALSGRRRAGS